jgi:hypothetical protein
MLAVHRVSKERFIALPSEIAKALFANRKRDGLLGYFVFDLTSYAQLLVSSRVGVREDHEF